MFRYLLPGRTIFGPTGGRLYVGWTEESRKQRQAAFDAGRKIDLRIEDLEVRAYGDAAISTFYRIGTVREPDGTTLELHLRISGVWVRSDGEWKLAHRHESRF
jgi:ketosteroid isomerase-like protein